MGIKIRPATFREGAERTEIRFKAFLGEARGGVEVAARGAAVDGEGAGLVVGVAADE